MGDSKRHSTLYNLACRPKPSDFKDSAVSDELLVDEWLEVLKDIMRLFIMIDTEKI